MSSVIFSSSSSGGSGGGIPLVAIPVAFPLVAGNKRQAFVGRMIQGTENTAALGKAGTKVALG